ncbi:MAG: hypothetical protein HYZ27_05625 [Deltaproteobacteria bacterium]|nr:hypothetical protein [Deltaproteobacteria bacterium]
MRLISAPSKIEATIVATHEEGLDNVAQHELVFIDRGTTAGLQRGHVLDVLRRGDELTGEDRDVPEERVGQLVVVEAREKTSTALVIYSRSDFSIGDQVRTAEWVR